MASTRSAALRSSTDPTSAAASTDLFSRLAIGISQPTPRATPAPGIAEALLGMPSRRAYADERLDRPALVHRRVRIGNVLEAGLEVEDTSGVESPLEDVVE